jgi:hypothetical protein
MTKNYKINKTGGSIGLKLFTWSFLYASSVDCVFNYIAYAIDSDSRSIMQVTKYTGDMHDLLDRNLRPVKPAMVDDTHYHHGKLKKRQNKQFRK